MNLERVESHLTTLERLALYLTQHGCDLSAQDAARALMRYFDEGPHPVRPGDELLEHENRALGRSYAGLRVRLKDIAEGRSDRLPVGEVAAFTRFYREHMLHAGPWSVGRSSLIQVNFG
ncbi:MAG TPA: hypothetical protein VKE95_14180 [Burkholderiales bacterium]|nr:hypothetical protein [Burkholderiales bacterium]